MSLYSSLVLLLSLLPVSPAERAITFEREPDRLRVMVDGRALATYVWNDPRIKRPYFAWLHAPNGVQLTRNHPPIAGKDSTDHDTMHPGLWMAFGELSGADFWRNRGTTRQLEFLEQPTTEGSSGRFRVRNHYESEGRTICEEIREIAIRAEPLGYLIDWRSEFQGASDFVFGDQEEMGLGVRMESELVVARGGKITNSSGLINEKQVWGQAADWCDFRGRSAGVLIMPDPSNFRRCWFHARDYGLLVANPFGQNAFTKGERSQVRVRAGEKLRLGFGILLHNGEIDAARAYREWRGSRP